MEFNDISHAYADRTALRDVTLRAMPGEVTCLIGPSGCGKTTLLRLAAGLLPLQSGSVVLDGEPLSAPGRLVPPEKRPVGLVFQEGALFPHLNVAQNIAFGLTGPAATRKAMVAALLDMIGLVGFENRLPHTLSGGQRQRVALARAMAPEPKVLLFDEPYANLDTQLRRDLREQARRMIRRTGMIGVMVTHDPEEVLEMADRIAILEEGVVQQTGTPEDVFDNPSTAKIAAMFGSGQSLKADLSGATLTHAFGEWPMSCLHGDAPRMGPVRLVIRPDALTVKQDMAGYPVLDTRLGGQKLLVHVEAQDGQILRVIADRSSAVKIGDHVRLEPLEGSIFAYPDGEPR
nr:ABC transporter ATP-binding protein [Aquisalinus flavus]